MVATISLPTEKRKSSVGPHGLAMLTDFLPQKSNLAKGRKSGNTSMSMSEWSVTVLKGSLCIINADNLIIKTILFRSYVISDLMSSETN